MIRFSTAMVLFGAMALLAWTTLTDERIRGATLLVLGMFALRTWVHHRRQARKRQDSELPEAGARGPM